MIEIERKMFESFCALEEWPIDLAKDAIVKETNTMIFLDNSKLPTHPQLRHRRGLGLGDLVAKILAALGITPKRVSKMLGRSCGCNKRKQKLNQVGDYITKFIRATNDKKK